jgi:hypothetical protein
MEGCSILVCVLYSPLGLCSHERFSPETAQAGIAKAFSGVIINFAGRIAFWTFLSNIFPPLNDAQVEISNCLKNCSSHKTFTNICDIKTSATSAMKLFST